MTTSCPELADIVSKLDSLDDPFWSHARACGRCVQAVTAMDPTIMGRSLRTRTLRPSVVDREAYDGLEPFVRGGMYQTWRATDARLGRLVVIKGLPDRTLETERGEMASAEVQNASKRVLLDACLRREALILADLHHPSIVTLLEAGQWRGGETFYAMEFVEGVTLRQAITGRRTVRDRLELLPALTSVAHAIAYAHKRKIVHRDLSPNNIMVGNGMATVIDWTTAKRLDASPSDSLLDAAELPETGPTLAALGTPGYAPAEQAAPTHDHRVDIFALGATLQFLVTGKNPFAGGADVDAVLANVAKGNRIELTPEECPPALAAIIRKATHPNPLDRYDTVEKLADDLQRFQSDQLVLAHRYTLLERIVRSRAFKPLLVSVAFLAIVTGGTLAALHYRDQRVESERTRAAEHDQATAQLEQKNRERDEALRGGAQAAAERDKARANEQSALSDAHHQAQVALEALKDAAKSEQSAATSQQSMKIAISKMTAAIAAQDSAEQSRDEALRAEQEARNAAERERVAEIAAQQASAEAERRERVAVTTRDKLQSELDRTISELARFKTDYDSASKRLEIVSAERDTAAQQRDAVTQERDAVRRDRDDLQKKQQALRDAIERLEHPAALPPAAPAGSGSGSAN